MEASFITKHVEGQSDLFAAATVRSDPQPATVRNIPVDTSNDYRVHLPLGTLTGPAWKNFSGIITPSFLNTIPFFMTN